MAFGQSERSMGVKLYGSTDLKHGHMDGMHMDCHEIKNGRFERLKMDDLKRRKLTVYLDSFGPSTFI